MMHLYLRRGCVRYAVLVAISGALVCSLACSSEEKKPEPVVNVQAATATKTTIERVVSAEAVLYPINQAAITPKISAPVAKFYVQRGARVKAGQLLATLENKDLSAAAIDTKGAYAQAEASYESTTKATLPEDIQKAELDVKANKQALDAAQQVYTARQNLFQQGAIPRRDLDSAQVAFVQAKNAYDIAEKHLQALQAVGKQQTVKSAQGQLESAKGKYMGAEAQLGYSEIRSPINGVVTDRPLYAGEMAAAGTPLITVMDTSRVVARAHIPQQDAALLKVGDQAEITATTGDKVPGKVTIVSPALDPNSTTVEIWVEAPNPKNLLRPGSNAQVTMDAGEVKDAVVVPSSAVVPTEGGGMAVMVIGSDGRAHKSDVKIGVKQGDETQIVEGVDAGAKVVTAGAYGLPDNTQVKVGPPPESGNKEADSNKDDKKDKPAGKPEE